MEAMVTATVNFNASQTLFLAVHQAIKAVFNFQSLKGNGLDILKDIKILSIF